MKIVVLMDNAAKDASLAAEHGLSLYIETGKHRILFDAGHSGAFANNAQAMGVDLHAVDMAVLSHGHNDHGGGLARFLQRNDDAPVYVSRHAFEPHYSGERDISIDPVLRGSGRLIETGDTCRIDAGVTLLSCNGTVRRYPDRSEGLFVQENGRRMRDDFRHEQYLLLEEDGHRVVVSGCSHKGVENVVAWLRPDVFIGGFHFMKIPVQGEGAQQLSRAAQVLLCGHTQYYTGHCTGLAQYEYLRSLMGERVRYLAGGEIVAL